ncbi:MAG TPA: O-antigen ligase family protein [Ktedonobacteraceae bacterium]|nr:O-antigen ligase family protein [Ktedonobacteraceae bacterium]
MQPAQPLSNGALPLGGGASNIDSQLQQLRTYHQRILRQRAIQLWWPYILFIVLGGVTAGIGGQFVLDYPKYVFGAMAALVIFFLLTWRVDLGFFLVVLCSAPFFPSVASVKSLSIYPAIPMLVWLFFVILTRTAFRVDKPVLPSFWAIWPLLALLVLAFISDIMAQVTWTLGVPHKINSSPVYYSEIYGVALFFLPLICIVVTTAALTDREKWLERILQSFLIVAVILALVVLIEFKRIGATVYTFRFSEPKLGWMPLKAIAQSLGLGCIMAYARLLYATTWRMRITYAVSGVLCLVGVYLTLQNSWWLEVGVALVVITFAYSRRLFVICCVAGLSLIPLVKYEIDKLSSVKSADYYRLIIWKDALRVWSKQPLLGVGPGNFWAYDQRFTQLPKYLRQFNKTGLGVSHNGYLQMLGELGPLGVCFYVSFMVVMVILSVQLFRRSNTPEKRSDRILGLIGLGLICGSALGDFTSGAFFLQPRQIGSASSLAQILGSWFVWGCVIYKDKLWRMARSVVKPEAETV